MQGVGCLTAKNVFSMSTIEYVTVHCLRRSIPPAHYKLSFCADIFVDTMLLIRLWTRFVVAKINIF